MDDDSGAGTLMNAPSGACGATVATASGRAGGRLSGRFASGRVRVGVGLALVTAATLTAAACGSSTSGSGSSGGSAAYTVSAASVSGVGTVIVNGDGRTFYMLTADQGGKVTCTDASGCTGVWPDTELPSGVTKAIAGSGIDASKLGTVTASDGKLYVTYGGWPLYTYTGDTGSHQSNGEGINSFGGTWYTISASTGQPVTSKTTSGGGGGSYGNGNY